MIAKQLAKSFKLKKFELLKKMEILKDFFHLNYNHKKGGRIMEILKDKEVIIKFVEKADFETKDGKVEMDRVWFIYDGKMKYDNRVKKVKLKEGTLFCDIELRVDKRKGEFKYVIHPKVKK